MNRNSEDFFFFSMDLAVETLICVMMWQGTDPGRERVYRLL